MKPCCNCGDDHEKAGKYCPDCHTIQQRIYGAGKRIRADKRMLELRRKNGRKD